MPLPNKKRLLALLTSQLEGEIEVLSTAVQSAADAATHAEAKPENKYDTRGLEASYLAGAQTERLAELKANLSRLRQLPLTEAATKVVLAALVELVSDGQTSVYWILPFAGGSRLPLDGIAVLTITAQSPVSRALLGKEVGDVVTVATASGAKDYEIVALS